MSAYVMVAGPNGCKLSTSTRCKLGESITEYHDDSKSISCVAVGPNDYFAVVCSDGAAIWLGPENFKSKMHEISRGDIKHISFGCHDQWAITMKTGRCYASLLQTTDILKCINEHNGDISYVSLCDDKNKWIVGYGDNNYLNGIAVSERITSFLDGIKVCKKKIKLVELGGCNHFAVHHDEGLRWAVPHELSEWFENSSSKFTTISLYSLRGEGSQTTSTNYNATTLYEQNKALKNKCNKLEFENEELKTKNGDLQTQIERFKGNNIQPMDLDDLYELERSLQTAIGRIMKEMEDRHRNDVLCITCLTNKKEIAFAPCGHLLMCQDCSNNLSNDLCPMCQAHIHDKIKIFR